MKTAQHTLAETQLLYSIASFTTCYRAHSQKPSSVPADGVDLSPVQCFSGTLNPATRMPVVLCLLVTRCYWTPQTLVLCLRNSFQQRNTKPSSYRDTLSCFDTPEPAVFINSHTNRSFCQSNSIPGLLQLNTRKCFSNPYQRHACCRMYVCVCVCKQFQVCTRFIYTPE